MDCWEAVDDYCDVWEAQHLQIVEAIPSCDNNVDQFVIAFEVEKTFPIIEEEEEEDEGMINGEGQLVRVEDSKSFTFWVPCPRFKHQNLTKHRISSMLSRVGVALHKQDFMADKISARADEIANAPHNKAAKLVPILVTISIVACSCSCDS